MPTARLPNTEGEDATVQNRGVVPDQPKVLLVPHR